MIDILILIILCFRISNIVKPKGYNNVNWILRTVGVWLLCEMAGLIISYMIQKNFWIMNLSGFLCAIAGYFFVQQQALNLPDKTKGNNANDDYGQQEY